MLTCSRLINVSHPQHPHTYTCSHPSPAHIKFCLLVKCNIQQDTEHESSKTVLRNPFLGFLFLVLYCSLLSLLKLQYVAWIILYSPSLLSNRHAQQLLPLSSVPFLQNRKFGVSVGCDAPFTVLQLFDCSNHLALQYQDLHESIP